MISCPDCKKKISETASSCPKCGYQLTPEKAAEIKKKETQTNAGCLVVIVIAVIIYAIVNFFSDDTKSDPGTEEQTAPQSEYANKKTIDEITVVDARLTALFAKKGIKFTIEDRTGDKERWYNTSTFTTIIKMIGLPEIKRVIIFSTIGETEKENTLVVEALSATIAAVCGGKDGQTFDSKLGAELSRMYGDRNEPDAYMTAMKCAVWFRRGPSMLTTSITAQ